MLFDPVPHACAGSWANPTEFGSRDSNTLFGTGVGSGQSRNDNRVLDLIFDNELVYVEYGRLVTKADYFSRIKWDVPRTDTIALEGMAVHVFGNTAIAVGIYQEKQPHDARHTLKRWRFVDTWVYEGRRGWILVAAGASPVSN